MSDSTTATDRRTRVRGVAGGVGLVLSILGFLAVRATVTETALPDDWVLLSLPAFGLVGLVCFVAFVSAFVPSE